MKELTNKNLLSLEDYEKGREQIKSDLLLHKKNRSIMIGENILLLFEDSSSVVSTAALGAPMSLLPANLFLVGGTKVSPGRIDPDPSKESSLVSSWKLFFCLLDSIFVLSLCLFTQFSIDM